MNDLTTIIFIDDQARFRRAVIQELKEHSIAAIGEADNGQNGLLLLKTIIPDVIILDLEMPVMDGNETFDTLKKLFPKMKVIILSQHDDTGVMENYISRGAKGYLPKKFIELNVGILAEGIKTVREGQTFFYSYDPKSAIKYTKRETEAIPLILQSETTKKIASELGVGVGRVKKLKTDLYRKTKTRGLTQFIKYGIVKGLSYLGKK
jgi:two-component system, NarL family, nitrate/nitrite response regulator NarL